MVCGLGFGLGFVVLRFGVKVQGLWFGDSGLGLRVCGLGIRVSGLGIRVSGLGFVV